MEEIRHYALCRAVGAGVPFWIDKQDDPVILHPMRLKDWGVVEQSILLQRKKDYPVDGLPEDIIEELGKLSRSVSLADLSNYVLSPENAHWRLWLSLRGTREYTQCVADIQKLQTEDRFREYTVCANQADGTDYFALMDWPVHPFHNEMQQLQGQKKNNKLDWKVEVHVLCEVYGISPAEVGELSIYQFRMLQWSSDSLRGKFTAIPSEELRHLQTIRKIRGAQ